MSYRQNNFLVRVDGGRNHDRHNTSHDSAPSSSVSDRSAASRRQQSTGGGGSSNTMSGYHLRSKAGGLLASGSNYLASRDWHSMASSVKQRVADAGAYAHQQQQPSSQRRAAPPPPQYQHHGRAPAHSQRSMSTSTISSNPAFRLTQPNDGLSSLKALKPGQETPVLLSGWVQRNVARDRHPQGWAAPDAPEYLEDGEIEFQVSIDGFVAKTLDAPTRSQRLFNQMARQLAALPRLPTSAVDGHIWDSNLALTDEPLDMAAPEDVQQPDQQQRREDRVDEARSTFGDRAISKLMEGADEETLVKLMENIGAFPTQVSDAEAASKLEGRTLHRPHAEHSNATTSNNLGRPSRQNTASSVSSSASSASSNHLGGSLFWANRTAEELHRLHRNLGERLRAYWIYRSGHRDVNIEVTPIVRGEALRSSNDSQRLLLAATRLKTDSTGQYTHRLVVPWHKISAFCSYHSSASSRIDPRDIEAVEVRAVLPSPSSHSLEPGSSLAADGADDAATTPWLRYPITEDDERRVRVISDIDDTVKHTGVLLGTKRILRNVFVLPFEEVEIPGVATWYQSMVSLGVGLHYVTNAPLELHRLVDDFFKAVHLPIGHITLRHYPSGTRSLLASWLEPAGERKRANIVKILDEFPRSKFILIGDSGELDLEITSELARERPVQVRGVFIRDVSSPRLGLAKSPTTTTTPFGAAAGGVSGGFPPADGAVTKPPSVALSSIYPPPPPSSFPPLESTPSSGNATIPSGMTEADVKRKQAFQARLLRATSNLPKTTVFRLFYEGRDVQHEAEKLVKELVRGETGSR